MKDVSKTERQISKSANFGLLYGMSGKTFAKYVYTNTGIELQDYEGEAIKQKWLKTYYNIAKKHQRVKDALYPLKVYEDMTMLGRKYRTNSFNEALNIQIQGSGAELLKQTLINIKQKRPDLRIANVIHDEIIIECDRREAEDVKILLKQAMEDAWKIICDKAKLDIEDFDLEVEEADVLKSIAKS
jgi:DNA polymerase I-like protein with 3'-5' exonuclease and polymerase domains